MQVDSAAEAVAGIAYRQLRDFLKERGQYVMTAQLGEAFGLPAGDDQKLMEALIAAGYLEEADELGGHPVSQKGRQLARAKFLKRMTRAQAAELLEGILARAREINSRPELTHYVSELHVFGSYLTDAPDLGDLDLIVKLERKDDDGHVAVERSKARARASGKKLSFFEELTYGEGEVNQLLKARKGRISLHHEIDFDLPDIKTQLVFSRQSQAVGD